MAEPTAADVSTLWDDYGCRKNCRVPVTFACDEQVFLQVAGERFGRFYTDPATHLRVQLEGRRWFHEAVPGDKAPGYPDTWPLTVQWWMEENEFFGCEVTLQDDDYAWAHPLDLPAEDLLATLADLDPEAQIRRSRSFHLWEALRELTADLTYCDRPVQLAPPGGGTQGLFTKAVEIRGIERLCLELYEAPAFVDRLLEAITALTLERIRAWHRLTQGTDLSLPLPGGWHTCDDSLQLLSPSHYERFVLPHHERLYAAMTTGPRALHLCGHSAQHFVTLRERLGVVNIDGPGPFVDHGDFLQRLGPEFTFQAQTDHSVLAKGSPAQIEAMMRGLMTPAAKQPGRFQIMGFLLRETPLDNVRLCYELGLRYGQIAAGDSGE